MEFVETAEAERAAARARAANETAGGGPTFRTLAHAWLEHVEFVLGAKPATLRDYHSMLAEPGTPHRRGRGTTIGRIMAAFGDGPAAAITTAQLEALLISHAGGCRLRDRAPARLPPKAQGSRPTADHVRIHDRAEVSPGLVRKILCRDVGPGEDEGLRPL